MYTDINIFLLHTQYIDLRVPVHPVFRLQLLLPVPGNRVDYPVPPVTGTVTVLSQLPQEDHAYLVCTPPGITLPVGRIIGLKTL